MKNSGLILVLLFALGCSAAPAPVAQEQQSGEIYSPDEDALNKEIAELSVAVLRKDGSARKDVMTRDVHAKHHGCLRATFKVNEDIPAEYRSGVFAVPGKEYAAWIRFSNGSQRIQADKTGDARGMAVKLMGVDGEKLLDGEKNAGTQDFLLINHDAFFVKDGRDYAEFFRLLAKGSSPVWFFFGRLPWRWTEFNAVGRIRSNGKKMVNPLLSPYFSATPYRLGDGAVVKYSARPCEQKTDGRNYFPDSPDYLRLNMKRSLDAREGKPVCFQFMIQKRGEPREMSVEDSRIPWDQAKSPFTPVASVNIPAQDFSSEAQMRQCENFSFTPWHSLPAHRPLGNINRTRKAVYEAISAYRHGANHESRREPGVEDKP
ncbi:MAG: catalase family protein [Elusimicrobia bacterium]|nr:catalase family protein [Elusimicrobiota bacterium]